MPSPELPERLATLRAEVEKLPKRFWAQLMLPLENLISYSILREKIMAEQETTIGDLILEVTYLDYDLEMTRRELVDLRRDFLGSD